MNLSHETRLVDDQNVMGTLFTDPMQWFLERLFYNRTDQLVTNENIVG